MLPTRSASVLGAPTLLLAVLAQQQARLDVQASNVPGLPVPAYLGGVRVRRIFGFGPATGVAIMVVMFSYAGTCCVGVTLDRASIQDPDLFARCLADGFAEVTATGIGA